MSRDITVLPAYPAFHPQTEWALPAFVFQPQLVHIYRPWRDGKLSRPWCEVRNLGPRFEPATSRLQVRHSTTQPLAHLEYWPLKERCCCCFCQKFPIKGRCVNARRLKIVFETSSDFFGRITLYMLNIVGTCQLGEQDSITRESSSHLTWPHLQVYCYNYFGVLLNSYLFLVQNAEHITVRCILYTFLSVITF